MSQAHGAGGDYDRFRTTFFEECAEILADLEAHLARVQSEPLDAESLNAVFRAAHSIKAGAGAFGYTDLVRFTHAFEALLDRMRAGEIGQSEQVAQVLVRAGDILAALVAAARDGIAPAEHFGADVVEDMKALLAEAGGPPAPAPAPAASAVQAGTGEPARWLITFVPSPDLFRNATEPLLLLRELQRLGSLDVHCDLAGLPDLDRLDPEAAYLRWTLRLTTDRPRADILEVFEFVDEACQVNVERQEDAAGEAAASSLDQTSALPAAPVPAAQSIATPASGASARRATHSSIRVDLARIDRLVNTVGELVITQAMLAQQIADLGAGNSRQAMRGHEELAALTRELQECVMAIRMQPVKSVFARMPRLVRELSAKLGKQVRLVTAGEQTEVDKTVIEELADPLTHMIRNSIDHGIEMSAVRRANGKSEEGTIELSAAHVGGNIIIQVGDDGAGLNRARLVQKATETGVIAPGANLSEEEIDDLIFAPGFSTAAAVTDVSGRGVGMDVVRRNIVNLGGRIQVQTTPGRGTRFTLVIPLTLAVLDGMIVAVGKERYILPLTSILESFRPEKSAVRRLAPGIDVVSIRGDFVRLVPLDRVFGVADAVTEPWQGLVVIVETAKGQRVGLTVDELLGQQQVVIKSLSENFDPVPGISGATILGNGRVALILDVEQLAERPHASLPSPERMALAS